MQGKSRGKARRRQMPRMFALKELSSPKVFYPGTSGDIRDYLPLNEPSIQRFLKHATIVETYWADVRCLDPKTDAPLEITAYDLTVTADDAASGTDPFVEKGGQSWTPLDRLHDVERSCGQVAETRRIGGAPEPQGIKLQMRIAMEHCDLGALRVLAVLDVLNVLDVLWLAAQNAAPPPPLSTALINSFLWFEIGSPAPYPLCCCMAYPGSCRTSNTHLCPRSESPPVRHVLTRTHSHHPTNSTRVRVRWVSVKR